MAEEKSSDKSTKSAASKVASEVQYAKKTARKAAKIAKQSKGNWYAAAAAAAKEAVKDPEWAAKTILHILIFTIIPLFLVVCLMFMMGSAILSYVENFVRGIMENNAVDSGGSEEGYFLNTLWDLLKPLTIIGTYETTKSVVSTIASSYSDEFFDGHTDEQGNSIGDSLSEGQVAAEYQQAIEEEKMREVFETRLTMVRNSAESRYNQYKSEADSLAGYLSMWSSYFFAEQIEQNSQEYITTSDYEVLPVIISVPEDTITDVDCAAVLALFSAQYNADAANVEIMALRYWLGMYSTLQSIFTSNYVNPSTAPIISSNDISISVGSDSEQIVSADYESLNNYSLDVPRWNGTFVPQYVLEQYRQDKATDEILAEGSHATEKQKTEATESKRGVEGATYPESVGLIDEFMAYTGVSCSLGLRKDEENDITYVQPYVTIGVRARTPYELGTDVAGLWSGTLNETDDSGKNRSFYNPNNPNLLSKTWTDPRGASYTRQEGFQYEYFLDMLQGYIDQYHLEGAEESGGFGSFDGIDGDGTDIVAEANRIYAAYSSQSSLNQVHYIWSQYYHSPSTSTSAWCCAFVYVCADHCGYIGDGNIFGPDMIGWCSTSKDFFDRKGRATRDPSYKPKPGDIIYFYNEGSSGIAHVGLVEYYDEATGKVHTIEGNCGTSPGHLSKNTWDAAANSFCYMSHRDDGTSVRRLIWGYASPEYPTNDPVPAPPPGDGNTETEQ